MNATAMLASAALISSLLTGVAPASAEEAPQPTSVDVFSTASIEEDVLEASLESEGIDLLEASSEDGVLEMSLASELGNGEGLTSDLAVNLEDASATLETDASTSNSLDASFSIAIEELRDEEIAFTITDRATGLTQSYSSNEGTQAAVPLVVGVAIGVKALEALLRAAAVVVVAGAAYVLLAQAIEAIRRNGSNFQHFVALRQPGGLFIGSGVTYSSAIQRVRIGLDVWSTTLPGANSVCFSARNRTPIGPEIDGSGSGKVWHFHPNPRTNAHCFYGSAR